MEHILKFKVLLESLQHDEHYQIVDIVKDLFIEDKKLFSDVIFKYFLNKFTSSHQTYTNHEFQISKLNDSMSKIIQQRTNNNSLINDSTECEIFQIKLNNLPHPIIQKISYFLSFTDHAKFQCCNLNIFIASRTPSLIYYLPTSALHKYMKAGKTLTRQQVSIARFKQVKKIELNQKNDVYLALRKWNELQDVTIHGEIAATVLDKISWIHVNKLSIIYNNCQDAVKILSLCENIIDLRLYEVYHSDDSLPNLLTVKMSNLRILDISDICDTVATHILQANANSLEKLIIGSEIAVPFIDGLMFNNLKELSFSMSHIDAIVNMPKMVNNLQVFVMYEEEPIEDYLEAGNFSECMQSLFKINSLRICDLSGAHYSYLPFIAANLESFVDKKRKFLKLILNINLQQHKSCGILTRILKSISMYHSNGFVLELSIQQTMKDNIEALVQWMDVVSISFSVDFDQDKLFSKRIIISNKKID